MFFETIKVIIFVLAVVLLKRETLLTIKTKAWELSKLKTILAKVRLQMYNNLNRDKLNDITRKHTLEHQFIGIQKLKLFFEQ